MDTPARVISAIDAAQAACRDSEIELHVPPEFVMDVLANSALIPEALRPEFRNWLAHNIRHLPGLGDDQRQTLLGMLD
ncbi:hypothetical protein [Roseiconus lacunae]|uniref:Uncharacterized protein n=1 Tax=Roseiconus lacunae TaxID=2605694 RepID=A0ABT7PH63_9BACT|nr:hypothetical protein [Roseiconus lacunae]MDM4015813.1 hypothetical protein [Roseiconus lacunae]